MGCVADMYCTAEDQRRDRNKSQPLPRPLLHYVFRFINFVHSPIAGYNYDNLGAS